jgi:hypothetical protein
VTMRSACTYNVENPQISNVYRCLSPSRLWRGDALIADRTNCDLSSSHLVWRLCCAEATSPLHCSLLMQFASLAVGLALGLLLVQLVASRLWCRQLSNHPQDAGSEVRAPCRQTTWHLTRGDFQVRPSRPKADGDLQQPANGIQQRQCGHKYGFSFPSHIDSDLGLLTL